MTDFQLFEMERYMSAYEQQVDHNLSESGVHPMLLRELLQFQDIKIASAVLRALEVN